MKTGRTPTYLGTVTASVTSILHQCKMKVPVPYITDQLLRDLERKGDGTTSRGLLTDESVEPKV